MAPVLSVGLIGTGLVGGALLDQITAQAAKLGTKFTLRIAAIMDTNKMLLVKKDTEDWTGVVDQWKQGKTSQPALDEFIKHMALLTPRAVVVDCTASEVLSQKYVEWMGLGLHVVTPNKKAFSGDLAYYKQIMAAQESGQALVYNECTVGAALPVLSTLNAMMRTGDKMVRIEGIFSGTMSYLFNTFSPAGDAPAMSFSACVAQAKALGYTEPDARDDLSGMDVVRKVIILGRLAGIDLSVENLTIQNIVPEPLQQLPSANDFMSRLPEFDAHFAKLNSEAAAKGEVLRYVGVVDPVKGSAAELRSYPKSHPFATLTGSNCIFSFTTERYPNDVIVQGAGAGAVVTASGIFNDVLTIADRVL